MDSSAVGVAEGEVEVTATAAPTVLEAYLYLPALPPPTMP